MNLRTGIASLVAMVALATSALASTLEKGTPVLLAFDESFSSRHVHAGDQVRLHVVDSVSVGGKVVIRRGTNVTATISEVHKNGRFGKNAQLKLDINPIEWHGTEIPLQPRQKGNMIGGTRGTTAAGAAGAGALVLGPIGLGAGYFVVGKAVNIKVGDQLETQVASDVHIRG